jgi:Nuclease-related domain
VMLMTACAATAAELFTADRVAPYVVGGVAASGIWLTYVLFVLTGGVASRMAGILGEEWTSGELRTLAKRGWYVVNHVMLVHVDIDHVVLGPGGFLAVETKYRSDWSNVPAAEHAVWATRARHSARDLQVRLRSTRPVRPLVALWGDGVNEAFPAPCERDGVLFCAGHDLRDVVTALPAEVPADEVRRAYGHLDKYVETRDRGEVLAANGPSRRSSAYVNDVVLAVAGAVATACVVLSLARLPPAPAWPFVSCALVLAGSIAFRRRSLASPRRQAVTTATVLTAGSLLALFAVIAVGELLTA